MILNYFKKISIKKILNKSLQSVKSFVNLNAIQSVGLLVDESSFLEKEALISDLVANGIRKDRIKVVVYRDNLKKDEVFSYPTFSTKHINWNGDFTENVVKSFIQEKFDLLISYYDVEKPCLLIITNNSKADFKAGFASIDRRLNNLTIETALKNHKIFVFEVFKYLKILKKI